MENQIGRKIYYDKLTGNPIVDISERRGAVIETTIEQDIKSYKELAERNRDSFDFIAFEYGEYSYDFAMCNGYRVNTETKRIEFSYPTEGGQPTEPIYTKPLSEKVKELEIANKYLETENTKLKKRIETSESAIMTLMDLQLM